MCQCSCGWSGLDEALALARGLLVPRPQEAGGLEHAVRRRGADGDEVAVEHHEGEPAVALQRVLQGKAEDGRPLVRLDPMIARDEGRWCSLAWP